MGIETEGLERLGKIGAKDVALAGGAGPAGPLLLAKKMFFGGGSSSKEMKAAAKLAKTKQAIESFAPNVLKATKDGRNTVSAERAMIGERLVDRTSKRVSTSGGNALEELTAKSSVVRGPGNQKAVRNDMAEAARKEKKRYKDPKVFKTLKNEEERVRMSRGMDDNAIHRLNAMRDEKSALIQGNSAGYENPRLAPQVRQSGSPNAPAAYTARQNWRNATFDNRPNRTAGSALLASRMNY